MELTFNETLLSCLFLVLAFLGGVLMLHGAGKIFLAIEGWWINRNQKGMIGRGL